MQNSKRNILVTNDDGFDAPGIIALYKALIPLGKVTVIAPDRQRSAVGHCLTFFSPVRVKKLSDEESLVIYNTTGTPTDCILLAVHEIMEKKPDIVVSGINRGPNLGDDVTYSGTVTAALEGTLQGIPSIACSIASYDEVNYDFAARFTARLASELLEKSLPKGVFLNLNVPALPESQIKGVSITRQGRSIYQQSVEKRYDPRGEEYYWISGDRPQGCMEPGTDFEAIRDNKISITPLQLSMTHKELIDYMKTWQVFTDSGFLTQE